MGLKDMASKGWLKTLGSAFAGLVGVTSGGIALVQYFEPTDGKFVALVNNHEVAPPVTRDILVYMDKDSVDMNQLRLMPQFSNPTKYAVEDMLITYKVESQNANIAYTDDYTLHRTATTDQVKNVDKTLYPRTEQPGAFMHFVMRHGSKADVHIRATYKGVDNPFEYEARILAKRIWNADPMLRKQAVMEDAYQYAFGNRVDSLDIYVLDGNEVQSYTGTSARILQDFHQLANAPSTAPPAPRQEATPPAETDTYVPLTKEAVEEQSQPVVKTVDQIADEAEEASEEAKKEGKTWYEWVLLVLCWLVVMAGLLCMMVVGVCYSDYKERWKPVAIFAGCGIAVYAAAFYMLGLEHFVSGFICFCVICLAMILLFWLTEKTKARLNLDDDSFWADCLWVVFFCVLCVPAYFICWFVYTHILF